MTRRAIFVLAVAFALGCATARVPPRRPREATAQKVSVHDQSKDAEVAEDRFATKQARELADKDRAAQAKRERRVEVGKAKPQEK
jgi:hypothetical protein